MQLTEYQKITEIPQAIKQYLQDKNSTQAQLAKNAGVGESYVTQILKGRTHIGETQIKDKYYIDLCRAIGYNITVQKWRHFDTLNYKIQYNAIEKAREKKSWVVVDGDTGHGKSYAGERHVQLFPNNTFYIQLDGVSNKKELVYEIAETVGIDAVGTAGRCTKEIAKKLCSIDDCVLIIDEAEHIKDKKEFVKVIKTIADKTKKRIGIALIGCTIASILKNGYERNRHLFRQTARRFRDREYFENDITDDIIMICNELGIKNKHIQNWLTNRIKNIDELEIILTDAFEESEISGAEISVQMLNELYIN